MATKTEKPTNTTSATITKLEVDDSEKQLSAAHAPIDASAPASGDSPSLPQENPKPSAVGEESETNGADSKAKEMQTEKEAVTGLPANHVEKKARRAERFGVPLQLSEREKRSSRAERFGSDSGSDVAKSSEELKRKARAERFGASTNSTTDEEAKKKARLARFGSNGKINNQEDEKRKARALRFAEIPLPHVNVKGNAEMMTAGIADTAGGT